MPPYQRRVRWKLILPVVMTATSVVLMWVSSLQWPKYNRHAFEFQPPASGVNYFINAPGFALGFVTTSRISIPEPLRSSLNSFDSGSMATALPAVAFFWIVVGSAMDRRSQGRNLSIDRPKVAIALFSFPAILFAYGAAVGLYNAPRHWDQIVRFPFGTFYSNGASATLWAIALAAYFSWKVFAAARHLIASKRGRATTNL